jgi:hypothetical protein
MSGGGTSERFGAHSGSFFARTICLIICKASAPDSRGYRTGLRNPFTWLVHLS